MGTPVAILPSAMRLIVLIPMCARRLCHVSRLTAAAAVLSEDEVCFVWEEIAPSSVYSLRSRRFPVAMIAPERTPLMEKVLVVNCAL